MWTYMGHARTPPARSRRESNNDSLPEILSSVDHRLTNSFRSEGIERKADGSKAKQWVYNRSRHPIALLPGLSSLFYASLSSPQTPEVAPRSSSSDEQIETPHLQFWVNLQLGSTRAILRGLQEDVASWPFNSLVSILTRHEVWCRQVRKENSSSVETTTSVRLAVSMASCSSDKQFQNSLEV
jgi:hypothetical protein